MSSPRTTNHTYQQAILDAVQVHDLAAIQKYINRLKTNTSDHYFEWANSRDQIIESALRDAIRLCQYDTVNLFFDAGVNPNSLAPVKANGALCGYLEFAIETADLQMVTLLIKRGVACSPTYSQDTTPTRAMQKAIQNNQTEIVLFLLASGARIPNMRDETALGCVAKKANHSLVQAFIEQGASIYSTIKVAAKHHFKQLSQYENSTNAEMVAECERLKAAYYQMVKILLDHQQGIDFTSKEGLRFAQGLNLTGLNFRMVSVDGVPVDNKMLKEVYHFADTAGVILTRADRDKYSEGKRRDDLIAREAACVAARGCVELENGILHAVPFWRAVKQNDVAAVTRHVALNYDVNDTNDIHHEAPIVVAAERGYTHIVKLLVAMPTINKEDIVTAVELAKQNHFDEIVRLLEGELGPNARDAQGNTQLMNAIAARDVQDVLRLIKLGTDINIKNKRGEFALERVIKICGRTSFAMDSKNASKKEDYLNILTLLLERHPDPQDCTKALLVAFEKGNVVAAALLLSTMQDKPDICKIGFDQTKKVYYPWYITLMYKALEQSNAIELLMLLKTHGANFNVQEIHQRYTLLALAIKMLPTYADILNDMNQFSASLGARGISMFPNALTDAYQKKMDDAKAEFSRQLEVIKYLLANGADPCIGSNEDDWTPLHILLRECNLCHIENAYEQIIACLLQYGADINARDTSGLLPVDGAGKLPKNLVRVLQVAGGSPNFNTADTTAKATSVHLSESYNRA